ncbi:MAG TPA: hypothetical protein DEB39_05045, partial [Planctomycetaceae bacterium]|nr:hypothetical protein [Planctomycetaceae bacterium]
MKKARIALFATILTLGIAPIGFAQTWDGGLSGPDTINRWGDVVVVINPAYTPADDPDDTGTDSHGQAKWMSYDPWRGSARFHFQKDRPANVPSSFTNGSSVVFDLAAAPRTQNVDINPNAVTVDTMTVRGAGWHFSGKALTGNTLDLGNGGGSIDIGAVFNFTDVNVGSGGWIVDDIYNLRATNITFGPLGGSLTTSGISATTGIANAIFEGGTWTIDGAGLSGGRVGVNSQGTLWLNNDGTLTADGTISYGNMTMGDGADWTIAGGDAVNIYNMVNGVLTLGEGGGGSLTVDGRFAANVSNMIVGGGTWTLLENTGTATIATNKLTLGNAIGRLDVGNDFSLSLTGTAAGVEIGGGNWTLSGGGGTIYVGNGELALLDDGTLNIEDGFVFSVNKSNGPISIHGNWTFNADAASTGSIVATNAGGIDLGTNGGSLMIGDNFTFRSNSTSQTFTNNWWFDATLPLVDDDPLQATAYISTGNMRLTGSGSIDATGSFVIIASALDISGVNGDWSIWGTRTDMAGTPSTVQIQDGQIDFINDNDMSMYAVDFNPTLITINDTADVYFSDTRTTTGSSLIVSDNASFSVANASQVSVYNLIMENNAEVYVTGYLDPLGVADVITNFDMSSRLDMDDSSSLFVTDATVTTGHMGIQGTAPVIEGTYTRPTTPITGTDNYAVEGFGKASITLDAGGTLLLGPNPTTTGRNIYDQTRLAFDDGFYFNTVGGGESTIIISTWGDRVFDWYSYARNVGLGLPNKGVMEVASDMELTSLTNDVTLNNRFVVDNGKRIIFANPQSVQTFPNQYSLTIIGVDGTGGGLGDFAGAAIYLKDGADITRRRPTTGIHFGRLNFYDNVGDFGPAIFAAGNLTLQGNLMFDGNEAHNDGGAVYMLGLSNATRTLTIDTSDSNIVFRNNTSHGGSGTAKANSIFLNQNIVMNLTGNNDVGTVLYIEDGIDSGHVGGNELNVNYNGNNFVQFGKNSVSMFSQDGTPGGNVNINGGTFSIVGDTIDISGTAVSGDRGEFATLGGNAK